MTRGNPNSKPSPALRDWRQRKAAAVARTKVLFSEGTDRVPWKGEGVELTDDNIAKVVELRTAMETFNPGKVAGYAGVTFPLAASEDMKKEAAKLGIPVTRTGIYFPVEAPGDLARAIAQFWEFAKVAKDARETVLKVERKKRGK
jgi:hypothetical protein